LRDVNIFLPRQHDFLTKNQLLRLYPFYPCLAQVSRRVTVRL